MPNNSYLRSRAKEQELVREYRNAGYISARSAGSKSPVDVWAFHPQRKELLMVQVKVKKGGSKLHPDTENTWVDCVTRQYRYTYGPEKTQ